MKLNKYELTGVAADGAGLFAGVSLLGELSSRTLAVGDAQAAMAEAQLGRLPRQHLHRRQASQRVQFHWRCSQVAHLVCRTDQIESR